MTSDLHILALESSGKSGSVAVASGEEVLASVDLDPAQRTARTLAPAIAKILAQVGWQPGDVQLVAVTIGPGSFTGLRIGVTTAKMFAYAAGAEVLAIPTLEVLADQVPAAEQTVIETVMDAQRNELFAARFHREANKVVCEQDVEILTRADWLARLESATVVSGPGLKPIVDQLPPDVTVAETTCWQPQAATVARLAYARYLAGQRDDMFQLVPQYYRRSYAEEARQARDAGAAHEGQSGPQD